jgi:dTDP-glucose 4,6-dehydratase
MDVKKTKKSSHLSLAPSPVRMLVTGGAGFIGANYVRMLVKDVFQDACPDRIIVLDALTYAGNLMNLEDLCQDRFKFVHGSILDGALVKRILLQYQINTVVHFAAESHVDNSITGPRVFFETNVIGTQVLLDACRSAWGTRLYENRFHISTDEVYGSLASDGYFTETTSYAPRSPYSASKAASDHLVQAYIHTYAFPAIITHCTNNYGPYQFPEKLIPLMISNCLNRKPLPVYGSGQNVRDWLYVEDHCSAIQAVVERGQIGEVYNIGGQTELKNIDLVRMICNELKAQRSDKFDYSSLIDFVKDRAGHDFRYAMDISKIKQELGWSPSVPIQKGLQKTIQWYLANTVWLSAILSGEYQNLARGYSDRLTKKLLS